MKNAKTVAFGVAGLILAAGIAIAQQHGGGHGGGHMMDVTAAATPKEAYEAANARMHQDMAITFSGNADVDFVRGMIPHHQGAIDMARIVLKFGKDPEVRKLAEQIIKAQEEEIAMMNGMLKRLDK